MNRFATGLLAVCLVAALSVPSNGASSRRTVRFVPPPLWSGLPTDDDGDGNGAYDRSSGLGVSVNCFDDRSRRHVLTVQFSSSRPKLLRFYAEVVPRTSGPAPRNASPLRTLSRAHPILTTKKVVTTCANPYAIFVAYPQDAPAL